MSILNRASSAPPVPVDRAEVARQLRDWRARGCPAADDVIDWAFSHTPSSHVLRRLRIESLIDTDDLDSAETLIAHGLRLRPADPSLTLLRAKAALRRGRIARAQAHSDHVLTLRPRHVAALELAAAIAREHNDHVRAADLLRRALDIAPSNQSVRLQLITALLDAGLPDEAEDLLPALKTPLVPILARIRIAQNRWLEALDLLDTAHRAAASHHRLDLLDQILVLLLDVLECVGQANRLTTLCAHITPELPLAETRALGSLLWLGRFRECAVRAAAVIRHRRQNPAALAALIVAASMLGRDRWAQRAIHRFQCLTEAATPTPRSRTIITDAWRRGLIGQSFLTQQSATAAGSDPAPKQVLPLAAAAIEVFDQILARPDLPDHERRDIRTKRTQCQLALGRPPLPHVEP